MTLQEENDELREKVRQLEELLAAGVLRIPREFGLTGTEETILGVLLSHEMGTVDQFLHALYYGRGDDSPGGNIVNVYICRLRKKLGEYGIEIKTVWGRGYSLTKDSKAIIRQMFTPEPVE